MNKLLAAVAASLGIALLPSATMGLDLVPDSLSASVDATRCVSPGGHVIATVTGAQPGSAALASSDGTADAQATVDASGRAILKLVAPNTMPRHAAATARVMTITATARTPSHADQETVEAAYLLGTHRGCAILTKLNRGS